MNFKSLVIAVTLTAISLPLSKVNAQTISQMRSLKISVRQVQNFIDNTGKVFKWEEKTDARKVNPSTGAVMQSYYSAYVTNADSITMVFATLDYDQVGALNLVEKHVYKCRQKKVERFFLVSRAKKMVFIKVKTEAFKASNRGSSLCKSVQSLNN